MENESIMDFWKNSLLETMLQARTEADIVDQRAVLEKAVDLLLKDPPRSQNPAPKNE